MLITLVVTLVMFGLVLAIGARNQLTATKARAVHQPELYSWAPEYDRQAKRVAVSLLIITTVSLFLFGLTRTSIAWSLGAAAVFSLLFSPVAMLSAEPWLYRLKRMIAPSPGLRVALVWSGVLTLVCAYLMICSGSVAPVLKIGIMGWLCLLLLGSRRVANNAINHPIQIILAASILWLPIEFDLVRGFHLPANAARGLEAGRMLIYGLGLTLFTLVAPLPAIGYTFRLNRRNVTAAAIALSVYAAIAIPLGMHIGFIRLEIEPWIPLEWFKRILYTYFLIAIPEELLFRGVIQNTLEHHWPGRGRKTWSLLLAATVFGAAHLNNPMPGMPVPNFPYMLMSGLAGIAYGWVWQRTRKITAAALTHAAVDWIWITIFQ